jgi:hypothetical protein
MQKCLNGMNRLLLDVIEIDLGLPTAQEVLTVYVNVYDNSLSRKWLTALNHLVANDYHLEKNYCFLGFADGARNGGYLVEQINASIAAINQSNLDYYIDDHFTLENSVDERGGVNHEHFNHLHRYFEDLQGGSGHISDYYWQADNPTRWHIRQLNLLCHEFESWQLSWRKKHTAPEWQRPSQLMCWLNAPRFILDEEDYELFGVDTINRSLGGVYVGVNKAVGKHHWEVFQDEGRDSRIGELTTTSLKAQTEAAGDFDIEWSNNPGNYHWQIKQLKEFREWLVDNGFDPEDKSLTIGHPQVGQVNLKTSFGTEDYREIWQQLNTHLNVHAIRTSDARAVYDYHWWDKDYMEKQIQCLG